jgi:uncharacterized protein (DUF2461 family)
MAFEGWPAEALEFYEGLAADNTKSYWLAHKDVYETAVLAPMRELIAELEPHHGDSKIFRPYRDVRFSKDKSPYKTEIAAVFGDTYVRLSADGLGAGRGMHGMSADQLDRYRRGRYGLGHRGDRRSAARPGHQRAGLRVAEDGAARLPGRPSTG